MGLGKTGKNEEKTGKRKEVLELGWGKTGKKR